MSSEQPNSKSIKPDTSSLDQEGTETVDLKKPAKSIYVLPNLLTSAGLFAGFYAIMQAGSGNFESACLAIYVAMLMDALDGRLARLTNTTSDFGSEYDSLADMVSFGVAPALMLYDFALSELGRFGSLVAFVYIACAALRLARFNVAKVDDKRFFIGVPSPGAAAIVASVVWVCIDYEISPDGIHVIFAIIMALLGLLMVSNIKYRSFKDFDFKDKMPFVGLILLILIISMIYLSPPLAFLVIGSVYTVSGAFVYIIRKFKRRQLP